MIGALPLRMPTMLTPHSVRMKNSGELKESTRGRRIGSEANRTRAPKMPPSSDATNEALSALAPSPFFAMGWPSRIVAWEPVLPGTEMRIEVNALAVLPTASMPTRSAMTRSGSFMVMTKGSMSARVLGPPMPGRNPTRLPIPTPRHMNINASG